MKALDHFPPTRTDALNRLQRFLPNAAQTYAARRNFDLGAGNHSGVSTLSPYVRTRVLPESEILRSVLGRFSASSAEKFIQEVFWRTYWKGWLELRPTIWTQYQTQVLQDFNDVQTQSGLRSNLHAACQGDTGLACFDAWAQELVQTGYLHNHARMWFASIWIFTLRLPWALGADFFLRHLLDGDPASNTLSWRWVAGMQTAGKTYLARESNIAKYTENRFATTSGLADFAPALPSSPHPETRAMPRTLEPSPEKRTGFLLHIEDASPGFALQQISTLSSTAVLRTEDRLSPRAIAPHISDFHRGILDEAAQRYSLDPVVRAANAQDLLSWANQHQLEQIVTPYAPTGPTATLLDEVEETTGLPLIRLRRPYDTASWPSATHGFFRFKKGIPSLIDRLSSPSFV